LASPAFPAMILIQKPGECNRKPNERAQSKNREGRKEGRSGEVRQFVGRTVYRDIWCVAENGINAGRAEEK